MTLKQPSAFQRVPDGLNWAAQRVRRHLRASKSEPDAGEDLARALTHWPSDSIWLNTQSGVLVALDVGADSACLMTSNALLAP